MTGIGVCQLLHLICLAFDWMPQIVLHHLVLGSDVLSRQLTLVVSQVQWEDPLLTWAVSGFRIFFPWLSFLLFVTKDFVALLFHKAILFVWSLLLHLVIITYLFYSSLVPQTGLHEERATKALQIICLFLSPSNRRKLHFLLKLMAKMSANPFLTLDPSQSTRSLVSHFCCHLLQIVTICPFDSLNIFKG